MAPADNYVRYYFGPGDGHEVLHTAFDRKADKDVSEQDVAACNFVLFGSPAQNRILAKIAGKLPFSYDGEGFEVAGGYFDCAWKVAAAATTPAE
jgi:hypothetical protein